MSKTKYIADNFYSDTGKDVSIEVKHIHSYFNVYVTSLQFFAFIQILLSLE